MIDLRGLIMSVKCAEKITKAIQGAVVQSVQPKYTGTHGKTCTCIRVYVHVLPCERGETIGSAVITEK